MLHSLPLYSSSTLYHGSHPPNLLSRSCLFLLPYGMSFYAAIQAPWIGMMTDVCVDFSFVFVGYLFSFHVSVSSVSMPYPVTHSQVIPADVACCDNEMSW